MKSFKISYATQRPNGYFMNTSFTQSMKVTFKNDILHQIDNINTSKKTQYK